MVVGHLDFSPRYAAFVKRDVFMHLAQQPLIGKRINEHGIGHTEVRNFSDWLDSRTRDGFRPVSLFPSNI
ncbi:MAG: hypothetical protein R6U02_04930 [Alkalibacterium sp.]|uniref:hypothetical protein n=1 Tax=Alkalibacterium sp. TaxID=1872447 RepID=UPI0039707EB0